MTKTVPEMLKECAATFEERAALYGDNYKRFGTVMMALLPIGITLEDEEDHNRFGVFVQIVSKLTRYAENFATGGHDDSLLDLAVYATMLRELDAEIRAKVERENKIEIEGNHLVGAAGTGTYIHIDPRKPYEPF